MAPRLADEYKKDHSGAGFIIESKGTGYGIGNLLSGACDIAMASRAATTSDVELARDRGIELKEYIIGAYAVSVIVNATNPISHLTREQVRDIFTGTVKNWKEVGGRDASINLFIRDPISGTYIGFQELAMENKPYALHPKTSTNYAGIAQNVANDVNGIGYTGLHLTTAGIKAVSIAGVAPSAASINDKKYPYARILHLYTNKDKQRPEAADFINFIQSEKGKAIMADMGFTTP